jgi:hypothetical protein
MFAELRLARMRKTSVLLICMFPLAVASSPPPEHRNVRDSITVDFLLESCANVGGTARGKIPYFDCDSYVYGVLDTYLQERRFIPKDQRSCFPETLTPAQVLDDAWHLDIKLGPKGAAPVLIEMLRKKYPCN